LPGAIADEQLMPEHRDSARGHVRQLAEQPREGDEEVDGKDGEFAQWVNGIGYAQPTFAGTLETEQMMP
jgi:hypothetical protein